MTTHTIAARTHGRYLVDRPDGDGPFLALVGFHGYGENAERMLDALGRIRNGRMWMLVSIQALNRFYARSNDTVVANWMTRQDRDLAIADNIAYVGAVLSAVQREHPIAGVMAHVGFSQGAAMAYRAAAFATPPAAAAIVLAGDVPPDVAAHAGSLPPVLIGRGTGDHWYTESKAAADIQTFAAAGVTPAVHVFDGGHVWDETFIARAGKFLDGLAVVPAAAKTRG